MIIINNFISQYVCYTIVMKAIGVLSKIVISDNYNIQLSRKTYFEATCQRFDIGGSILTALYISGIS